MVHQSTHKASVLVVTPYFYNMKGGLVTMTSTLVRSLADRIKPIVAITAQGDDPRPSADKTDDILFLPARIPYGGDSSIKAMLGWLYGLFPVLRLLSKLAQNSNIRIMHMHFPGSHLSYFTIFCKFSGLPYIVTLHGSDVTRYVDSHFLNKIIVNFTLRNARKVVAVSNDLAKQATKTWPWISDKLCVIYNGTDIPDNLLSAPHSNNSNTEDSYYLCVGNLVRVKGFDIVLAAWKYLKQHQEQVPKLIIIGGGDQKEELEKYIAQNDLDGLIILTGPLPREHALAYMRNARGVIVPSRNEGLGYTVLEAGLMQKPVIASRVGGIVEIVENEDLGLLVETENPTSLAHSVIELDNNPQLSDKISRNLKNRIERVFSTEKMACEYYQLYQDVMKTSCVD